MVPPQVSVLEKNPGGTKPPMDDSMRLSRNDKMELIDQVFFVNGRTFVLDCPNEPLFGVKDGKLITIVFRGCGCTLTEWEPEEIEGEYRD